MPCNSLERLSLEIALAVEQLDEQAALHGAVLELPVLGLAWQAKHREFQNRTVQGGLFIQLLYGQASSVSNQSPRGMRLGMLS